MAPFRAANPQQTERHASNVKETRRWRRLHSLAHLQALQACTRFAKRAISSTKAKEQNERDEGTKPRSQLFCRVQVPWRQRGSRLPCEVHSHITLWHVFSDPGTVPRRRELAEVCLADVLPVGPSTPTAESALRMLTEVRLAEFVSVVPSMPAADCDLSEHASLEKHFCLNGHPLTEFRTPEEDFECDICGKAVATGTKMFGCRRCDYDRCTECLQEQKPSQKEQKPSLGDALLEEHKPSQKGIDADEVQKDDENEQPAAEFKAPEESPNRDKPMKQDAAGRIGCGVRACGPLQSKVMLEDSVVLAEQEREHGIEWEEDEEVKADDKKDDAALRAVRRTALLNPEEAEEAPQRKDDAVLRAVRRTTLLNPEESEEACGFAGPWDRAAISQDCTLITWPDGTQDAIKVSGETILISYEGRTCRGSLHDGLIWWSDGDVWRRTDAERVLQSPLKDNREWRLTATSEEDIHTKLESLFAGVDLEGCEEPELILIDDKGKNFTFDDETDDGDIQWPVRVHVVIKEKEEEETQPDAKDAKLLSNRWELHAAKPLRFAEEKRDRLCPKGHPLKMYKTLDADYGCDECHRRIERGTTLFGCRICNYDRCAVCDQRRCTECDQRRREGGYTSLCETREIDTEFFI